MGKVITSLFFFALLVVSNAASAVSVRLLAHNQRSSSGTRATLMWLDCGPTGTGPGGAFVAPCINPSNPWVVANGVTGSNAIWNWDPVTRVLSSRGLYWPFSAIGSNPVGSTVLGDRVVNLQIDVLNQVTTATNYVCTEGTFLVGVGANGCGGWSNGLNGAIDSSVAYNVGGNPYCEKRTLAGDDLATGLVRGVTNASGLVGCDDTGGAFVQYTLLQDNLSTGGTLILSNGICIGAPGAGTEPQVYAPCANANWITFSAISNSAAAAITVLDFDSTPSAWGTQHNNNVISGFRISPNSHTDITDYRSAGFDLNSIALGWDTAGGENPEYLGPSPDCVEWGCVYIDHFGQPFSFLSFIGGGRQITIQSSKGGLLQVFDAFQPDIKSYTLTGPKWEGITWLLFINGCPGAPCQVLDDLKFSVPVPLKYVVSADTSLFDESAMSQGTGDTVGNIVVACGGGSDNEHAAIFASAGETIDLGDAVEANPDFFHADYPCVHINLAQAINAAGTVAGVSSAYHPGEPFYSPWIWTDTDGFQMLNTPRVVCCGLSINDSNMIVGTQDAIEPHCIHQDTPFALTGFIWTAERGAQNLNELVSDFGGFYCIYGATKINNKGQILASAVDGNVWLEAVLYPVVLLPDADADGAQDFEDNCLNAANADQRDADGDGYGNACDADLNNSGGAVNFADLALFRAAFGTVNANADLNGSGGKVNFADLAMFRSLFGKAPGPSGIVP